MENILKRKLGKSGIEVSPICPGCGAIGGNNFMQGIDVFLHKNAE